MKKKLWVIIVFIALGSLAGVYLTKDSRAYNKAEELVVKGDYSGALVYYNKADAYPDWETLKEKINYCGYKLAEAAVAAKDWETAMKYYEDLYDSDQQEYCKAEWTKELIQPLLDEYGLTDAALIHFEIKDQSPKTRRSLIYFDREDVRSYAQAWTGMPVYHSNMFEELSDTEKLEFFQKIYEIDHINGYYTGIMTDTEIIIIPDKGITYTGTYSVAAGWKLKQELCPTNSDSDFIKYFYYTRGKSGSSSSSIDLGEKCYVCNGTGVVRYNYGSSDLEAILSGHDPYTYGQCSSCGGTGRAK